MKVICLTPWFPVNESDVTGTYILDSINALIDQGCEVEVLITRPWRPRWAGWFHRDWIYKKKDHHFQNKPYIHHCYYLSIPRNIMSILTHWSYRKRVGNKLKKMIKENQCQLIHAHTELAALAAIDIGKYFRIPTVMTLHGIDTKSTVGSKSEVKRLYRDTLENSDRVVLVGEPLRDFFQKFTHKSNMFKVVPNGFRLSEENKNLKKNIWNSDFTRFISVSNLHEGKGIDINLKALATLKRKGILNWSYIVVGEGHQRPYLEALVKDLELSQKVFFQGAVSPGSVFKLLLNADVFILPSYREAFGIAYLEAMSCGLLAIGVQGQGPQAFIKHRRTGLLVSPNDAVNLAETLNHILFEKDQYKEMAELGRQFVLKNFTWENHASKLMEVFNEVINE